MARPKAGFLNGWIALAALAALGGGARAAEEHVTAVTDVRLFDGEKVVPRATVVFSTAGKILAAGPGIQAPAGAEIVDGKGRTLLPGLIDSHTHAFPGMLERALVFGVTTELDMFSEHRWAATMRRAQAEGKANDRADLFSAGTMATAAGGHGTQFGLPIPTLSKASEADEWVAARIAEGSDYIKAVAEDGSLYGAKLPTLDRETLAAVIAAAKKRGKLSVVHVSTYERGREAFASGASGLAHLFIDRAADDDIVRLAADQGAFVIPTLIVAESSTGHAGGGSLATDARLAPYLTRQEIGGLTQAFPRHAELSLAPALESVRRFHAAGVPILAGSDAPNPGTAHGAALHRELELLVEGGLTPSEALSAATSVPARTFGLADRGRVALGLAADLLLVEGDPTADVTATRAIARVWKRGHAVARPTQEAQPAEAAAPRLAPGPVSDFDSGQLAAAVGAGWVPSTDQRMGGASTVELTVTPGGAGGSAGALTIAGEIKPGFPYPWAGALFFPGAQPMSAVDLSAARELVFWARGAAGTYRVMVFSGQLARIPAEQSFEVGPEWREVVLPLSGFGGLDVKTLKGILWSASMTQGTFKFEIDSVRLR